MTVETRPREGAPARAYVSLGANLGQRAVALGRARAALFGHEDVCLAAASAVAETEPVDVLDQPRFLNQVLALETALAPRDLLELCLAIEKAGGRDRSAGPPRGPRTIDLDILLYDGRALAGPGLTIPHPRLARRGFLLGLLDEIGAPRAWVPAPEAP